MFDQTLGMRLRAAYLTFHRRANQFFAQFDVTADQFVVLTLLADAGPLAQSALVARAASDPNTIAGMLARLEQRGLVRRETDRDDARRRLVSLTAEGRSLQRTLYDESATVRDELDRVFTPDEHQRLGALLERIPEEMHAVRTAAAASLK